MSEHSQETWDAVGFAMASRYRTAALLELRGGAKAPAQVARKTDLHLTHAAAAMRDCREEGLVELMVEDRTKNKIQALTDDGKRVAEVLESVVSDAS